MKKLEEPRRDEQLVAIPILLATKSRDEAAKKIGISRATLYRWFEEKEFQAMYRAAQREIYDHAMGRLMDMMSKAIDTLESVLDSACSPAIKVQAAQAVLNQAKAHCLDMDVEDRILALEKKLAELSQE